MRQLLCLAVVLSLASFANAELKIKPQVPTPRPLIREAFMPRDEVLLSFPMDLALGGKPTWHWKYNKRKLADLEVSNAQGKKLSESEIREALRKPTVVLLSVDGKPVHEYYLSIMKPETLVIIDKLAKPAPAKSIADE